tara:strand:+ start:127 stop:351 length:225 start_codon:yes stop_codon:yes gene_type:complete
MFFELLILGGYGQFVWPAFIFAFVSCLTLYLKTKKTLEEQEKVFLSEYEQSLIINQKTFKEKETAKEAVSVSAT